MKNAIQLLLTGGVLMTGGCASSGLSPRERPGQDLSSYLYATEVGLASDPMAGPTPDNAQAATKPSIVKPIAVAVAQIGEVTPPTAMLDELGAKRELFSRVSGVSGIIPPSSYAHRHHNHDRQARDAAAREHAQHLRALARNLGAEYLLVYGGTVETTDRGTPLSLLDVTIVGMFVVPSRLLEAEGRAAAAMIEVDTGRVVATATADADARTLATAFGREGAQHNQMRGLRDDVVEELTQAIVERLVGL